MRSSIICRLLMALVPSFGILAGPHAFAADDAPTATTPPATANYTDQPRVEHHSGVMYSPTAPSYGGAQPLGGLVDTTYTIRRPDVILFPPAPPALGDPLPRPVPPQRNQPAPPAEVAPYLHEIFMPQLGTLLYHNDLPRKWRLSIEAYRSARDAALQALRAQIEDTRSLDPAAQRAALADFALTQDATLRGLEAEAERLRELLTHGSWFNEGSHWNDWRQWRLGDDTQWESNLDELRVLRAATYYERGLSIDQRDLLREMALDLATLVEEPLGEISLAGPGPALIFSPGPARLRLPATLPPELEERLTRYRQMKSVLKRELRDAIYTQDRVRSAGRRGLALRTLAAQQAPVFAELHVLEEQIRQDLQDVPGLTPPASPGELPPPLLERVERYLQAKTELQETLTQKLQELRAELPFDRVEFARVGGGYGVVHVPSRQTRRTPRPAQIDAELKVFNTAQVARFNELTRERAAIQAEVQRLAEALPATERDRSLETLLRQFEDNVQLQQRWANYQEYRDATLLPGLSPAQRRLLFGAGVNRLLLPLLRRT